MCRDGALGRWAVVFYRCGVGVALSQRLTGFKNTSTVAAVVVGIGFVVSLILLLQGLTVLGNWTTTYGGRGGFTVEECQVVSGRLSNQVRCQGRLVPDENPRPLTSEMIGPQAAFGSSAPSPGAVVEVYFQRGDSTKSYPLEGRTTELIRAVVGVIPTVFLVAGTGAWLGGWSLTRHIPRDEVERSPYRHRFPQRFGLRSRGAAWALVGALWWLADRWFVDGLLGSAGLG